MQRLLFTSLMVAMTLLTTGPTLAVVLFSDDFENPPYDIPAGVNKLRGTNGWSDYGQPQSVGVKFSSSGMNGQVASGQGGDLVGGHGNQDGGDEVLILPNGFVSGQEYTLSWTWKVNVEGVNSHGNGIGFNGVRASIAARGDKFLFSDPADDDIDCSSSCNVVSGVESIHDVAIVINESTTTFFVDGNQQYSSSPGFTADSTPIKVRMFFSKPLDNKPGGYIDDIMLRDDTPEISNFWRHDVSADWNIDTNWSEFGVPNSAGQSAVFGSAITTLQTVFTNTDVTVNDVQFDNPNTYIVAGGGTINLTAGTQGMPTSGVSVAQGTHQFQAAVQLNNDATADVTAGASLHFINALNLGGHTLTKIGDGELAIRNDLVTGGGMVSLQQGTISGNGTVGGDLLNDGGSISPGNSSNGAVSSVPEPTTLVFLTLGAIALGWNCGRRQI